MNEAKIMRRLSVGAGRCETNRGAQLGDVDALDLQHGFGERAMLVGGHVRRQDSGKTTPHRIQLRHIGFIEPKEFSVSTADDGEKFLLLPGAVFAHEDNHFLPVKRFGWRFGHVKFLARFGRLHPGFHRHDTDGGSMGDAHEPGGGGKCVFFAFIR